MQKLGCCVLSNGKSIDLDCVSKVNFGLQFLRVMFKERGKNAFFFQKNGGRGVLFE